MAQEETHRFMNHRVSDEMVIINHHVKRAMPFSQFDKQLREKGGQAGVLALLHHHLTGDAVSMGGLLYGGNQIAGKTFLLVIALIKGVPAKIALTCGPLRNERCFSITCRARNQRQSEIMRAGKFSQQTLADHCMVKTNRAT